ncbi:MAG: RNA-binding region RNP-1 [Candidatus Ozemobacter sibiricus]|jgi:RNA recognition motif-containing protein|uniref:RNA-binding region RNP-1 n=1 Tax=Candidatus Ozemobacter sibiricus TaxID=2268124 RepID=A0A367ZM69_9BACT|nr:MAG: RNA-binding region RNP-1 [Candidatus Ozemobacter sibiricus]
MSVKVFVGNLPFAVNDEKLKTEFSKFGNVESARVVTDKHTNRSRGYGFVEFTDQAAAEAAIQGMNGQPMEGRPLTVNLAKTQGNERA